ncbi:hypothetical protein BGZ82_011298, partial [Podila clonocystis]
RPESGNKRQVFDLIPSNNVNTLKKCLPDTDVKVHQRFIVRDHEFESLISTVKGNNLLRAGVDGDKQFQELEFTVTPFFEDEEEGGCLQEDFDYRVKVHGQISGYLQIEDGFLAVIPEFDEASPLYFHKSSGQGLRIGHFSYNGPLVLATNQPGMPLILQRPESGNKRQVFDLIPSNNVNTLKKCLPDNVKVRQPFVVLNHELDTLISTVKGNNILRAGVDGNKQFQKLEFIVTPFSGGATSGDCIYEDVDYRFSVTGQISGFLHIENGFITIVPEFDEASPLYFHKSSGQGLRIGQWTLTGPYVVTTTELGMPLSFQRPESGNKRQVFELIPSNNVNKESVGNCLPDTDAAEGSPFLVKNHALKSVVSIERGSNILVGGVNGNQNFEDVQFNVLPFNGPKNLGHCLREDFEYRFEVRVGHIRGYLQIQHGLLAIVREFDEASPLYFHKSAGQGLRIAEMTPQGPFAITTMGPGIPLIFERAESKNERQVFDLIPAIGMDKKVEACACDDNQEHSLW